WQNRMSVPFMLSIDYLHINAHPYLPPTPLRSGFGYYFHFTPGLTPWAIELTAPPVGGTQNSSGFQPGKFQFIELRTQTLGHV
ncbi:MAG: hypothetical protein J6R92_05540, partial [Akkermansia sp.]|nr:hypothetical protein [Akkermansia sp.]